MFVQNCIPNIHPPYPATYCSSVGDLSKNQSTSFTKKRNSYKSALAYETGPLAEGARRGQMRGLYPHKVIFFLHSTSSSKFPSPSRWWPYLRI